MNAEQCQTAIGSSPITLPVWKVVLGIAQELKTDWLITQAVLSQKFGGNVHGLARGFVLMKEVSTKQDHVHLLLKILCKWAYFMNIHGEMSI